MTTALAQDGDYELRELWPQLAAVLRRVLKCVSRNGDCHLNYSIISNNIEMPCLPGTGTSKFVSEKTVAKYCHMLEQPPLSLIQRMGKRGCIGLTARGARLMRLVESTTDSE